jgi:hypothetical protein
MTRRSAPSVRRLRAVEAFQSAAETIGEVQPGMALFAITRGQFSMIDAVLACLESIGPARLSLWTWTVAEYEVECLERLRQDERVTSGLLVIDSGARGKNAGLLAQWKAVHGPESVRYVYNHAKIATLQNDRFKVLLRGSMNLNFNPRFEQLDITEGGDDFDLVHRIESELPILADDASGAEAHAASRVSGAFGAGTLEMFAGAKVWAK